MPTFSLAMPWIGGLMKWTRRYMIDQMNSDYVKFARAEGLSEKEIYRIHISRNAIIPIVHGIPANILGCLTGALYDQKVFDTQYLNYGPTYFNLLADRLEQWAKEQ